MLLTCIAGQCLAEPDGEADVTAGAEIYIQCTGCHAPAYHRTGPRHCGLIGRRAGSVEGFDFTPAMQQSGIIWNRQTLDQFLRAPMQMIEGTSMGFAGIGSAEGRRQLIAFLASLDRQNPLCR